MRPALDPKVALANSYMEHFSRIMYDNRHVWIRTPNGWCHATEEQSRARAKALRKEAIRLYGEANGS